MAGMPKMQEQFSAMPWMAGMPKMQEQFSVMPCRPVRRPGGELFRNLAVFCPAPAFSQRLGKS